jgi:hypothetical protein
VEYRVNPGWIANPADFAPFAERQRVQLRDGKGEIQRNKGCKAFAPQPTRTVGEPTTTTDDGPAENVVVVPDGLTIISSGDALFSSRIDRQVSWKEGRELDEIGGLSDRGTVRVHRLFGSCACRHQGEFVPSAAINIVAG